MKFSKAKLTIPMKSWSLLIACFILSNYCFGQTNTFPASGNVGIGTTSPGVYKLNVIGTLSSGVNDYSINSATFQLTNESKVDGISAIAPTGAFRWYTNPNNSYRGGFLYQLRSYDIVNGESGGLLTINGSGNVGIGTASPQGTLDVAGVIRYGNNANSVGALSYGTGLITLEAASANTSISLLPSGSGSVGVGTTDTKGYKLAVAGNMIAESVKVKLQGAWPDFVFAKSYALPTLKETETHIGEKGHLPGIPSAAEVKVNGIDLGEMNAKLLQKIEELTLHLIDQNRKMESMQTEIVELKKNQINEKK